MALDWTEVGERVYVRRHPFYNINTALVVGDGAALVMDTLSYAAHAQELLDAVRRVTPAPWTVVNTHHHFDHAFGNEIFAAAQPGCDIWGHEAAAAELRDNGAKVAAELAEEYADAEPEFAAGIAAVTVVPPNRTLHDQATLDIGGRTVELRHLGRGHTAGDIVLRVPDAAVLLAGDLVEQGAPPGFGDSYPLSWPHALTELAHLATGPEVVVPGHGNVVDRAFVEAQHAELAALAWLIREGHADGFPAEEVAKRVSYPNEPALEAVRRGYAELST